MERLRKQAAVWTRRSLLGGVIAAAPVLAWANADPAPGGAPGIATQDNGRNLLTVPVTIDGQGPFQFVVDTGADRSVISDAVVRRLGLADGTPLIVEGVVRSVDAKAVRVGVLSVGPITQKQLNLPVLPHEQLGADGYLGLDVINGYRLSMDFARNEMRLLDPISAYTVGWQAPHEVQVHLTGDHGHLRAFDCYIDGVRAVAFIDTGAEISVGNGRLYAELAERDSSHIMQETIPLTGVTGGEVLGRVTTLKRMKLGGLSIDESRVAVADLQVFRLWGLADRPAILIGMNWLRRFSRVSLDFGRKDLRFDLASRLREEAPLPCRPGSTGCRYQLGSPNTIPRPSVAT